MNEKSEKEDFLSVLTVWKLRDKWTERQSVLTHEWTEGGTLEGQKTEQ